MSNVPKSPAAANENPAPAADPMNSGDPKRRPAQDTEPNAPQTAREPRRASEGAPSSVRKNNPLREGGPRAQDDAGSGGAQAARGGEGREPGHERGRAQNAPQGQRPRRGDEQRTQSAQAAGLNPPNPNRPKHGDVRANQQSRALAQAGEPRRESGASTQKSPQAGGGESNASHREPRQAGESRESRPPRAPRAPRVVEPNPIPPITFPEALPVSGRRDEIAKAIAENQVVIVSRRNRLRQNHPAAENLPRARARSRRRRRGSDRPHAAAPDRRVGDRAPYRRRTRHAVRRSGRLQGAFHR